MRAVAQRVERAEVRVDGARVGAIGAGLAVLLGIASGDTDETCAWMAAKLARLRIFDDPDGRFDRSVQDIGGSVLVVSQFTLVADTRKGTRPSFTGAATPDEADRLYQRVCELLATDHGLPVERGVFGAHMELDLVNDGPVTIVVDRAADRNR